MKKRKAPVLPIAVLVILLTGVAVFNAMSAAGPQAPDDGHGHGAETPAAPQKKITAADLASNVKAADSAEVKPISTQPLITSVPVQKEAPNPNAPSSQWDNNNSAMKTGKAPVQPSGKFNAALQGSGNTKGK